jgi:hypothetical protein
LFYDLRGFNNEENIIANKECVKVVHKANVGVSVDVDVAKWLDLQAQTLTNNDVLELEKESRNQT